MRLPLAIACLALLVAVGGTGYAAISGPELEVRYVSLNPPEAGYKDVIRAHVTAKGTKTVGERVHGITAFMDDHPDVKNVAVAEASNTSPIVVTTREPHGLASGDRVVVYNVGGNTAANNTWIVTVTGPTAFSLNGSVGSGAYTGGGTVTNRPMYYGFLAVVGPRVDRGGLPAPSRFADDIAGFVTWNRGPGKGVDANYVGHNEPVFPGGKPEWWSIFTGDANAEFGINLWGTIQQAGITLGGTYGRGIDFIGTFNGPLMRLKNGAYVAGIGAGGGTVNLFKINALNELQVDALTRFNAGLVVGDGMNVTLGSGAGTKIGTSPTQRIGHWGAPPIPRPTVTGSRKGNPAVTSLLEALARAGFVVNNTSG